MSNLYAALLLVFLAMTCGPVATCGPIADPPELIIGFRHLLTSIREAGGGVGKQVLSDRSEPCIRHHRNPPDIAGHSARETMSDSESVGNLISDDFRHLLTPIFRRVTTRWLSADASTDTDTAGPVAAPGLQALDQRHEHVITHYSVSTDGH